MKLYFAKLICIHHLLQMDKRICQSPTLRWLWRDRQECDWMRTGLVSENFVKATCCLLIKIRKMLNEARAFVHGPSKSDQYLLSYQSVVTDDDLDIFARSQVFHCLYGRLHLGNRQRRDDGTRIRIHQHQGTQKPKSSENAERIAIKLFSVTWRQNILGRETI